MTSMLPSPGLSIDQRISQMYALHSAIPNVSQPSHSIRLDQLPHETLPAHGDRFPVIVVHLLTLASNEPDDVVCHRSTPPPNFLCSLRSSLDSARVDYAAHFPQIAFVLGEEADMSVVVVHSPLVHLVRSLDSGGLVEVLQHLHHRSLETAFGTLSDVATHLSRGSEIAEMLRHVQPLFQWRSATLWPVAAGLHLLAVVIVCSLLRVSLSQ